MDKIAELRERTRLTPEDMVREALRITGGVRNYLLPEEASQAQQDKIFRDKDIALLLPLEKTTPWNELYHAIPLATEEVE